MHQTRPSQSGGAQQLRQLGDVGGDAPGLVEAELVDRDSSSKPFGPTLALRIGKIAVEGEAYFLHEGTNAEMKSVTIRVACRRWYDPEATTGADVRETTS
jgi:hypothetical protein